MIPENHSLMLLHIPPTYLALYFAKFQPLHRSISTTASSTPPAFNLSSVQYIFFMNPPSFMYLTCTY